MSTIRVDNFGPSAGGTTYSARGIAKAWVNFDGTGTIAARDSENVSSLTDNGTGDYTVNFSNAFGAADYAFATGRGRTSAEFGTIVARTNVTAPATSSLRIGNSIENWTSADEEYVNVIFHGDLA